MLAGVCVGLRVGWCVSVCGSVREFVRVYSCVCQ